MPIKRKRTPRLATHFSQKQPDEMYALLRLKFIAVGVIAMILGQVYSRMIPINHDSDQETAASDHHYARVHIKVYRGPGHEHHFAPHGYWIKQPADDEPHHH